MPRGHWEVCIQSATEVAVETERQGGKTRRRLDEATYAAMICSRIGMTGNVERACIQKSWGRVGHML